MLISHPSFPEAFSKGVHVHLGFYYLGEKLAYGLGITSPDWQYAIDINEDLEREKREEQESKEKALREQREEVGKIMRELEAAAQRPPNPMQTCMGLHCSTSNSRVISPTPIFDKTHS